MTIEEQKIVNKSCILNDVNALRKKLKCESSRKTEPFVENIASDGSIAKIAMRASFFELAKSRLVEDMQSYDNFVAVTDGLGAVAFTADAEKAFVK